MIGVKMSIFRQHRHRINYWSHSKLANRIHEKLGATKKLHCGTMEEWDEYHLALKQYKFANWLDDKFWDGLQNIVYYPYDVYSEIRYAFKARFTDQRHSLQSKLPKWQYRDYRELLLFATFDSFCDDFMIREKGRGCEKKMYKHFEWECNLRNSDCGDVNYYGDDKSHPDDELIPQALNARKLMELYRWWRIRRSEILSYRFDGFDEENRLDDIDNEKLKELMDLRLTLWT